MADKLKVGDVVSRQKEFWKYGGWLCAGMPVKITEIDSNNQFRFEGIDYLWSGSKFDLVEPKPVRFKVGDYARRRDKFLLHAGWHGATTPQLIISIEDTPPTQLLRFEGDASTWQSERFELAARPAIIQTLIDAATKPLHFQIEALDLNARTLKAILEEKVRIIGLRDARIRVLEGDITHIGARYQKVIDDLEQRVAAVKCGKSYDLKRVHADLDRVTMDRDYWKHRNEEGGNYIARPFREKIALLEDKERVLQARLVVAEQTLSEARRSIAMINAMTNTAVRHFNVK